MRRVVLALALSLIGTGAIAAAAPPSAQAANTPAAQLHALFDKAWDEEHAKPSPGRADYKLLWSDPSVAHEQAQLARQKANLATLKKIDVAKLDPNDQLSWRLFEYQLDDAIAVAAYPDDAQGLIIQLWGPQLAGDEMRGAHYDNAKGYETLVNKLNATGLYLAAFTARLQQAMAKGITQPRGDGARAGRDRGEHR